MLKLLFGLALLAAFGCKARGGDSVVNEAVDTARPPAIPGYSFVGCRPNFGECFNSCADHNFFQQTEASDFCIVTAPGEGPYECHCLAGDGANDGDGIPDDY